MTHFLDTREIATFGLRAKSRGVCQAASPVRQNRLHERLLQCAPLGGPARCCCMAPGDSPQWSVTHDRLMSVRRTACSGNDAEPSPGTMRRCTCLHRDEPSSTTSSNMNFVLASSGSI